MSVTHTKIAASFSISSDFPAQTSAAFFTAEELCEKFTYLFGYKNGEVSLRSFTENSVSSDFAYLSPSVCS